MSLDDEAISKIAKAVRLERIDKVWKDPKKAQAIGMLFIVTTIYSVIFLVLFIGFPDVFTIDQDKDWKEFKKITLDNMDCYGLKKTLLDLQNSEFAFKNLPDDIESQIIARCI